MFPAFALGPSQAGLAWSGKLENAIQKAMLKGPCSAPSTVRNCIPEAAPHACRPRPAPAEPRRARGIAAGRTVRPIPAGAPGQLPPESSRGRRRERARKRSFEHGSIHVRPFCRGSRPQGRRRRRPRPGRLQILLLRAGLLRARGAPLCPLAGALPVGREDRPQATPPPSDPVSPILDRVAAWLFSIYQQLPTYRSRKRLRTTQI